MKRISIVLAALAVVALIACAGEKKAEEAEPEKAEAPAMEVELGEKMMYYTCPMEQHKHVHSQEPGKCADCGMDLVAVVQAGETDSEFYTCPMPEHSHVRNAEPGKCDECGMDLVPAKLEGI